MGNFQFKTRIGRAWYRFVAAKVKSVVAEAVDVKLSSASGIDRFVATPSASSESASRLSVFTTIVRIVMFTITAALTPVCTDLVSASDMSQQQVLVGAARSGDLKTIETLIAGGINPNRRDNCQDTALVAAVKGDDPRIVGALLKAGARVDFRGTCSLPQESVLCVAAERGNLDSVRLLLEAGAPPNGHDPHGRTPLMCAADHGHLEVMRFLLRSGADVHAVESAPNVFPRPIKTALMHAAMHGRWQAVELLLEHGARVNAEANYDFTALAYAAKGQGRSGVRSGTEQDYAATVRVLAKYGADLDARVQDDWQSTPLMLALRRDHNESTRALLDGGANPNVRGREGETGLMIAVKRRNLEVVRLLLSKAADVSIEDNQGRSAAQFAHMLAFPEIEEVLLGRVSRRTVSIGSVPEEGAKAVTPSPQIVKILWRVILGERPSGGPWLVDGVVIYHTFRGHLVALAAKTGARVWEMKTNIPVVSQPSIADGVLYVGMAKSGPLSRGGRVLALQGKTGKIIWDFPTSAVPEEPFLSERVVYVKSGRDYYAVDRGSGKQLWRKRADSSAAYRPVVFGTTALFGDATSGHLVAVDATSGRVKWEFAPSEGFAEGEQLLREMARVVRTREGQEFVKAQGPRELFPFAIGMCKETIIAGRAESEVVANIAEFFGPDLAAALLAAARKTICPPGTTPEQVMSAARRAERPSGKERLASLPSVFGDKAFFRIRTGVNAGAIYAVELESGQVVGRWPTRFGGGSAAVADDKALYYMDGKDLVAVSIKGGERLWSLDLQYEVGSPDTRLVSIGDYLYTATAQIIKIERTTGTIKWKIPAPARSSHSGKGVEQGQVCAFAGNFAFKADLVVGRTVWRVSRGELAHAGSLIACDNGMLFYYEDADNYPAYGIEISGPRSSED